MVHNTYKLKGERRKGWSPYDPGHSQVEVSGKTYHLYKVTQYKRDANVIARNLRKPQGRVSGSPNGYLVRVKGSPKWGYGIYRRHQT